MIHIDPYLEWLSKKAIPDQDLRLSYQKLLFALYEKEFTWVIKNDGNRSYDGEKLRFIFTDETGIRCQNTGACNVLEMMIALAIRCDFEFMWDPDEGDRSSQWFWCMLENLGVSYMDDWNFNQNDFDDILDCFLSRKYDKDGYGSLFYVDGSTINMRKYEIWYQMNYWIKSQFEY